MFCYLVMMSQEMINLVFIGQLDNHVYLAAVGMGNCIQNMLGLSVVIGLSGSLETLVSQAYGSSNIQLCCVYVWRARLVIVVSFVPIYFILANTSWILLKLNQN